MYCGTNELKKNNGTKYKCFKKGIFLGKIKNEDNLEVYMSSKKNDEKIFCGLNDKPNVKSGTLDQCLRKGFGVGLHINFLKNLDKLISDINFIINNYEDERRLGINKKKIKK